MLGPGDLSVIAGIPYQFDHPIITEALRGPWPARSKKAGKAYKGPSAAPLSTRGGSWTWGRHSSATART